MEQVSGAHGRVILWATRQKSIVIVYYRSHGKEACMDTVAQVQLTCMTKVFVKKQSCFYNASIQSRHYKDYKIREFIQ